MDKTQLLVEYTIQFNKKITLCDTQTKKLITK